MSKLKLQTGFRKSKIRWKRNSKSYNMDELKTQFFFCLFVDKANQIEKKRKQEKKEN